MSGVVSLDEASADDFSEWTSISALSSSTFEPGSLQNRTFLAVDYLKSLDPSDFKKCAKKFL